MNLLFYFLIFALIVTLLIIVFTKGIIPRIKRFLSLLKKYAYVIMMFPVVIYVLFYIVYQLNPSFKESLALNDSILNLLGQISLVFFGSGIFSASLKFLDSMDVFGKNFKKIILSKEFEQVLSSKIDALAYSKEHLIKQNNLADIWQNVTLCKYEKEFPKELYDKLKKKLNNDLFSTSSLSYYYKNFQINYNIKMIDDEHIQIEERSSFTIMRPTDEPFNFDFYHRRKKDESDKTKFECSFKTKNQDEIKFEISDPEEDSVENEIITSYKKELSGHKEYHIESYNKSINELDKDRFFTFGCSRIIDDLTINITHDSDLCVIFKQNSKDKLYHNGAFEENILAFINRDVLLPGEKFTMFFYRKK